MKSTKKLIISIAALVIALAVSVSSTFAWFTINSTPEVGDFELNVTAGEGLYIRKVDGTYTSTITTEDVLDLLIDQVAQEKAIANKEAVNTQAKETEIAADDKITGEEAKATALETYVKDTLPGEIAAYILTETFATDTEAIRTATSGDTTIADLTLADFVMRDVTSADGKAFTNEKKETIKANDYANVVGSYLSLNLTFRAESELYVGVSDDSAVNPVGDGATLRKLYAWEEITLANYSADDTIIAGTTVAKGEALPATRAANAARLSFVNGATVKVWDPNADKGYTINTANMANAYRDALLGNTTATTIETTATANITLLNATTAADDTNSIALLKKDSGEAYYGGNVSVNIWLEGWDADCFNSILSDKFTTNIIFKGSLKV